MHFPLSPNLTTFTGSTLAEHDSAGTGAAVAQIASPDFSFTDRDLWASDESE